MNKKIHTKPDYIPVIVSLVILTFIFSAFLFLNKMNHPETNLVGSWKEVSWDYEKADIPYKSLSSQFFFNEQIKNEISKDLIIHNAELWVFDKNSVLHLKKKEGMATKLHWKLKGRGHILELKYNDNLHEFYQIKVLTKDKMVLHFNNDMEVRGIVKIEFERVRE